jgi:hypothetical protein
VGHRPAEERDIGYRDVFRGWLRFSFVLPERHQAAPGRHFRVLLRMREIHSHRKASACLRVRR